MLLSALEIKLISGPNTGGPWLMGHKPIYMNKCYVGNSYKVFEKQQNNVWNKNNIIFTTESWSKTFVSSGFNFLKAVLYRVSIKSCYTYWSSLFLTLIIVLDKMAEKFSLAQLAYINSSHFFFSKSSIWKWDLKSPFLSQ